jgi:hypothetical protein
MICNRLTCGLGHWRVIRGICLRAIFIIGHNFTLPLYPFFKFLTDIVGRLLRHAASFEKQGKESQTDHTKERGIFYHLDVAVFHSRGWLMAQFFGAVHCIHL